jgi:hypothetical protein
MCPTILCGQRASSIKKSLADLHVQQGSLDPNARAQVSKAFDVRAIMGLQDTRASTAVNPCKTCGHVATIHLQCNSSTINHSPGTTTVQGNLTVWCHAADRVWRGGVTRPSVPTPLKISFVTSS